MKTRNMIHHFEKVKYDPNLSVISRDNSRNSFLKDKFGWITANEITCAEAKLIEDTIKNHIPNAECRGTLPLPKSGSYGGGSKLDPNKFTVSLMIVFDNEIDDVHFAFLQNIGVFNTKSVD